MTRSFFLPSFALAFLLIGVFVSPTFAASFSDVSDSHRFSTDIEFVQSKGLVNGYADGTYKPDATINRAEFTKIIIGSLFPASEISACDTSTYSFSDIPSDAWYKSVVCTAKKNGIINGYADGTFKPESTITLPEALKIVLEGYKVETNQFVECTEKTDAFTSPICDGTPDPWYFRYIAYFGMNLLGQDKFPDIEYPLYEGNTVGTQLIERTVTRGEMAYFIQKLERRKALLSPENFFTYTNPNAGFTLEMPIKTDWGNVVSLESYDATNKEFSVLFVTNSLPEWLQKEYDNASALWDKTNISSPGFFSKAVSKDDLKPFFTPIFEKYYSNANGYFMGMDEGEKLPDANVADYAKRCVESIQFTPFAYGDGPIHEEFFPITTNFEKVTFSEEWCDTPYSFPFYDTKNNLLLMIRFGQDVPFSLGGEPFLFKNFQIK